jgi:hypothetical protein
MSTDPDVEIGALVLQRGPVIINRYTIQHADLNVIRKPCTNARAHNRFVSIMISHEVFEISKETGADISFRPSYRSWHGLWGEPFYCWLSPSQPIGYPRISALQSPLIGQDDTVAGSG